jgi:hypothetical protein
LPSPRSLPTSPYELSEREVTSPSNLKVVGALDNYSLVFVIFINFFGQLKDWVRQVLFLVSCPKGQVEKYVNVEACKYSVILFRCSMICRWPESWNFKTSHFQILYSFPSRISAQVSPNQAKWATSSPWFQWNRPISVKKRSFSRPVSLFKSVFFSPIIILFLQYSHKRSSHVPEIWPIQGLMFNILFQTR